MPSPPYRWDLVRYIWGWVRLLEPQLYHLKMPTSPTKCILCILWNPNYTVWKYQLHQLHVLYVFFGTPTMPSENTGFPINILVQSFYRALFSCILDLLSTSLMLTYPSKNGLTAAVLYDHFNHAGEKRKYGQVIWSKLLSKWHSYLAFCPYMSFCFDMLT